MFITPAELAEHRADAESRMGVANGGSNVTVRRITGRTTQDEDTGLEVPVWDDVYEGPFRLGGSNAGSSGTRTLNVGGVEVQVATRVGHFPAGTPLADSDLIEVTAGENAGLVFRIIEAESHDQATAHRVPLVSTDRPTEW